MKIKSWVKSGFQKFCEGTSMHGFVELFQAINIFWKIFWFVVISGALSVTSYQVYKAVDQFNNQKPFTIVQPVENFMEVFASLKICLSHWIQWVSFTKAKDLGFTREALLYGMSYWSNVYSSEYFNISIAKVQFVETFERNNFSTMSDFYAAIAIGNVGLFMFDYSFYVIDSSSGGYDGSDDVDWDALEIFKYQFQPWGSDSLLFCFSTTDFTLKRFFNYVKLMKNNNSEQHERRNTFKIDVFDQYGFGDEKLSLTPDEYNSYVADWMSHQLPQLDLNEPLQYRRIDRFALLAANYSNISHPKIVLVDGYSSNGVILTQEVRKYVINIKASAHKWKNKPNEKCIEGDVHIATNTTCMSICNDVNLGGCTNLEKYSMIVAHQDFIQNLCRKGIFFINSSNEEERERLQPKIGNESETDSPEQVERIKQIRQKKRECSRLCVPGCEQWTFDTSINTQVLQQNMLTVASKTETSIEIEYPFDGQTLIMIETDSQSWEDFVGSVGGLIGIWTGASIVSLVQLIYLCCCTQTESIEWHWYRRQSNSVQEASMNEVVVTNLRTITTANNHEKGLGKI